MSRLKQVEQGKGLQRKSKIHLVIDSPLSEGAFVSRVVVPVSRSPIFPDVGCPEPTPPPATAGVGATLSKVLVSLSYRQCGLDRSRAARTNIQMVRDRLYSRKMKIKLRRGNG